MTWDWEKLKEQQGQRGGGPPPQMDELINKIRQAKIPGGSFIAIVALIALLLGWSTFFTIESGSVGIVQRFGAFVRISPPGPNFKLPFGIEKVTKIRQDRILKAEFGFTSGQPDGRTRFSTSGSSAGEALMLTGDLNVAVVPWIVQYQIKDPYAYLFKVHDVEGLLRDLSEATMRLVVGDRSINEVINKRKEIADKAKTILQQELDHAETGIHVANIELKRTNVPGPVQSSFNEVNQAIQEKEKTIYQAREDYNKAIPAARGEAERTIKAAEGYALERINRAKGDAARFRSQYSEYNKAKDVTKRRLYLETLRDLLPRMGDKYIIDSDQQNVLPLLNLGNLTGDKK